MTDSGMGNGKMEIIKIVVQFFRFTKSMDLMKRKNWTRYENENPIWATKTFTTIEKRRERNDQKKGEKKKTGARGKWIQRNLCSLQFTDSKLIKLIWPLVMLNGAECKIDTLRIRIVLSKSCNFGSFCKWSRWEVGLKVPFDRIVVIPLRYFRAIWNGAMVILHPEKSYPWHSPVASNHLNQLDRPWQLLPIHATVIN